MALRDRIADEGGIMDPPERRGGTTPVDLGAPPPAGTGPETPSGAGGSEPPPSGAGDESPGRSFPVPPVPPPPGAGPIFSLAGGGGGGASSFARPGTAAAKPFRSQYFATNRAAGNAGGAMAPPARFGAGTPVTSGGVSAPFLPEGLDAGAGQPGADDELQRILALMRGGGVPGGGGGL